jgi:hypothetical protein
MELEQNYRPNFRVSRCCGTCKFFLPKGDLYKKGKCVLPRGINFNRKEKKERYEELDNTHSYACCDNHQWRTSSIIASVCKETGIPLNEFIE